jgi:MFS family permease
MIKQPSSQQVTEGRKQKTNPNIVTYFFFTGTQALGRGIWFTSILSLYIEALVDGGSALFSFTASETIGIVSGIMGVAMLVAVLPAGWLADRISRAVLIKTALIFGMSSLILMLFADGITEIAVALFLWGIFHASSRPAVEAIVADSMPTGTRSKLYARIHLLEQIAMASGPVLNIVLFLIIGNTWEVPILRQVIFYGVGISIVSTLSLVFFKDKHSLGQESESVQSQEDDHPRSKHVPIILLVSNFIIGIGAGMTVKYFGLFFKNIYSLNPIDVQIILGLGFLATGVVSILAQKFSMKKGRVEIIFIVQILAILCLFAMAYYPPIWLVVILFVFRGALMNASAPLSRSILMDFVPKKSRGLWTSLQSVAWGLFWNGSALIGGFLIGDDNFRLCFLITAIVYVCGTIPVLFIRPAVKMEQR